MRQDKLMERNRSIMQALSDGEPRTEVARRFNLSYSQTFRAEKAARRIDDFAVNDAGSAGLDTAADNTAPVNLMQQIGATGLKRFGGTVDDEYERALKTLTKRAALFREMGDDPNVAAMLQATKMTLRRVSWYAETDGVTDVDKQAKDFLQSCLDDMSSSFTDVVDQALGMLQYGFAPAELVYKKRMGQDPGCCTITDPVTEAESDFQLAHSKYDDGRIGWRKWLFMAPESLSPGSEWEFDPSGGIQGINQTPPPSYKPRFIPIDKAILFRTTAEKNSPEGRSILRAMWPAYYMYRNLQEIEAISAERMGAGFPVVYLGSDVPKDPNNSNSDMYQFKNIVRNVRVDEQMGLVVPYAKMGGGAAEGKGVLFELVSPPSRGVVDFNQVITRYEQRAMMVGLAQFVHLGMNSVGARALGETSLDFFTLAVSAWADSLADTINRFAVDRLMRLNYFEGLTVNPHIAHESVMRNGLAEVATYINTLMQAQVLTPGPELEKYVRQLADLPPKPETVDMTGNDAGAGDVAQTGDTPGDAPQVPPDSGTGSGGPAQFEYNPDQPRDDSGKWGEGGSSGGEKGKDNNPTWGGGETKEIGGYTVSTGRFAAKDKWAVTADDGGPGPWANTPEDAVSEYKALQKSGEENRQATAAYNKAVENVLASDVPSSADIRIIGNGSARATSTQSTGILRTMGINNKDSREIVSTLGIYGTTGAGSSLHDVKEVVTAGKAYLGKSSNHSADSYADLRGAGKPGAKSTQLNAVNDYQRQLEAAYADWSAECADALAGAADDEARRRLLEDDYLPLLFTRLNTVARTTLPDAVELGLDGRAPDAAVYQALADAMDDNSAYLSGTFIPAVKSKLEAAMLDGDVAAALGSGAGAAALGGALAAMGGRVSGQAGTFWTLYNRTITETAKGTGETVTAYLDPRAKHCDECPQFASEGGKEYASIQDYLDATGNRMPGEFACFGGCRCELKYSGAVQKREAAVFDYNPDQPRGDDGKWGEGGSSGKETGDPSKTYSVITETNADTALLMATNGINPELKPLREGGEFAPGAGMERQGTYVAKDGAFSKGSFGEVRVNMDVTGEKLQSSPELKQLGRNDVTDALGNENGAVTIGAIPSGSITSIEVHEGGKWVKYTPQEYIEKSGAPSTLPKLPSTSEYKASVNAAIKNDAQSNRDVEAYSRATTKEKYQLAAGNGLISLNDDGEKWAFG